MQSAALSGLTPALPSSTQLAALDSVLVKMLRTMMMGRASIKGSEGVVNTARMWKVKYGAVAVISHGNNDTIAIHEWFDQAIYGAGAVSIPVPNCSPHACWVRKGKTIICSRLVKLISWVALVSCVRPV